MYWGRLPTCVTSGTYCNVLRVPYSLQVSSKFIGAMAKAEGFHFVETLTGARPPRPVSPRPPPTGYQCLWTIPACTIATGPGAHPFSGATRQYTTCQYRSLFHEMRESTTSNYEGSVQGSGWLTDAFCIANPQQLPSYRNVLTPLCFANSYLRTAMY